MANEEILTALKNAIERDEDIEEASQTMINAGYSAQEVGEAKDYLQRGVLSSEEKGNIEEPMFPSKPSFFSKFTSIFSKKKTAEIPTEKEDLAEAKTQQTPFIPSFQNKKSEKDSFLVMAVILLICLIIALSLAIIFRESIINLFN